MSKIMLIILYASDCSTNSNIERFKRGEIGFVESTVYRHRSKSSSDDETLGLKKAINKAAPQRPLVIDQIRKKMQKENVKQIDLKKVDGDGRVVEEKKVVEEVKVVSEKDRLLAEANDHLAKLQEDFNQKKSEVQILKDQCAEAQREYVWAKSRPQEQLDWLNKCDLKKLEQNKRKLEKEKSEEIRKQLKEQIGRGEQYIAQRKKDIEKLEKDISIYEKPYRVAKERWDASKNELTELENAIKAQTLKVKELKLQK